MNVIKQIINRLVLSNKDKSILGKVLSPMTDSEIDEILYGSYYYYSDEGIGTWDIDNTENISEDEISS